MKPKQKFLQVIIFLVVSGLTLLLFDWQQSSLPMFFFKDPEIPTRIHTATSSDYNTETILLTRILHNKVTANFETIATSTFRTLDPILLFSLPGPATMYDWPEKIHILFPIEFPLFVVASFTIIRYWPKIRHDYRYLKYLIAVALIFSALFIPPLNTLRLIPLIIVIRLITVFGLYTLLKTKLWSKN